MRERANLGSCDFCVEISLKSSKRLQRVCLLVPILYYEGVSSFWGVVIFHRVEISLKSSKRLQRVFVGPHIVL